ncbi:hypothetical protein ABIA32_001292 [Streptacidiphilus sp. MAP12-20]|uniref:hypothetical protein n=1 Tax=Streptacidiphilus sp. MAP12-20 TaxID=3156299 RepID=UPI003519C53F
MREVIDVGELADHCDNDSLVLWTAQGLRGRGRAWVGEDAAIAAPSSRPPSPTTRPWA